MQVERIYQGILESIRLRITSAEYGHICNMWINNRNTIVNQLANLQMQRGGVLQESEVWRAIDYQINQWLTSFKSQYGMYNSNAMPINSGFNTNQQMPYAGPMSMQNDYDNQNRMMKVYGSSQSTQQQQQQSRRPMPIASPQTQRPVSTENRTIVKSAGDAYDPNSVVISGVEGVSLSIGDGYVTSVSCSGNVYKILDIDLRINVYDVDILPFALKEAQGYDFVKASYIATMTIDERPSIVDNLMTIIKSAIEVNDNPWKTLEKIYETLKDMPANISKKIERTFIDTFNRNLASLIGEREIEPATTLMGIASWQNVTTSHGEDILAALSNAISVIKNATVLSNIKDTSESDKKETEEAAKQEPTSCSIRLDKRYAVLTRLKFPGSVATIDKQTMVVVSSWFLADSAPDNILEHLIKRQCTEDNYTLFILGTNYNIKYNVTKEKGCITIVP